MNTADKNMKYQDLKSKRIHFVLLCAIALVIGAALLFGARFSDNSAADLTTTAFAQQDALLERRLSQVEQRFYYIESRINRLESESRYPGVMPGTSRAINDAEISLIRSQLDSLRTDIQSLRLRMIEAECGLIRLDERTLTTPQRSALRETEKETGKRDSCRANPNAPLRLSARP